MASRQLTKPPMMTEAEWSRQFKSLFETLGWRGYHTWMSRFSEKGFPDWCICNPQQKRTIYAELKSEIGKVTKEQQFWLDLLKACGHEVYVFRPSDFDLAANVLTKRDVLTNRPDAAEEERG